MFDELEDDINQEVEQSQPVRGVESIMRGKVRIFPGLQVQAFLSPVFHKRIFFRPIIAEDVDALLATCMENKKIQEAKSRVLAFRLATTDGSEVRPSISFRNCSKGMMTTEKKEPAKSSSSSCANSLLKTSC